MAHSKIHPAKLLFVCSRNRIRSLTAEKLMEGVAGYETRSAGTQPEARIVITEGHIRWADMIFCMEIFHLDRIRAKYPEAMQGKRAFCLHIRDEYKFMEPNLLDELRPGLAGHVTLPEE